MEIILFCFDLLLFLVLLIIILLLLRVVITFIAHFVSMVTGKENNLQHLFKF